MKMYGRVYFSLSIFGDFREVANSSKIKPTRKIPDIRYVFHRCIVNIEYWVPQYHYNILTDFKNACYLQIVRRTKFCIEQ